MRIRWLGCLLLLLVPIDAVADDQRTVAEAASAVLAAVRGEDTAALMKLGQRATPDPEAVFAELVKRGEPMAAARLLHSVGEAAFWRSEFVAAEAIWSRARAIFEQEGDSSRAVGTLTDIALSRLRRGDYEGAEAILAEAEENTPALAVEVIAHIRATLGIVAYNRARYQEAQSLWLDALAVFERAENAKQVAWVRSNLGNLLSITDRWGKALVHYDKALAYYRGTGNQYAIAQVLANIAIATSRADESADALRVFGEALEANEAIGNRLLVSRVLQNRGTFLLGLAQRVDKDDATKVKHIEEALADQERALDLARTIESESDVASSLANIGNIFDHIGRFDEAEPRYTEALEIADRIGDPGAVRIRVGLGHVLLEQGRSKAALDLLVRGVELFAERTRGASEDLAIPLRLRMAGLMDLGIQAAIAAKDAEHALFFVEHGRAASLVELMGGRDDIERAVVPESLRRAEAEARERAAAALQGYRAARAEGKRREIRARKQAYEAAQAQVGEIVDEIARKVHEQTLVTSRIATLAEVQAALAPDEAVVAYAFSWPSAYAIIIDAERAYLQAAGDTDTLLKLAEQTVFEDPAENPQWKVISARLLLWSNLRVPARTKRVYMIPHTILSLVPWGAIVQGREVVLVPSASALLLLREQRTKRGEQVLAVGDPLYGASASADTAPGARQRYGDRLVSLPGTRKEVEAIGDVVLVGEDASETKLREVLPTQARWRAIHIAAHGLVDAANPRNSSLVLTWDEQNDGMLSVQDLVNPDLTFDADLVVLSACESGRGKLEHAEGVMGLTRAFLAAGVPRVIASLWKVDDDATQALMTKFYALWNPTDGATGLSASAALKQAQEYVASQEKWKHPYYWGAWVLWGLGE